MDLNLGRALDELAVTRGRSLADRSHPHPEEVTALAEVRKAQQAILPAHRFTAQKWEAFRKGVIAGAL